MLKRDSCYGLYTALAPRKSRCPPAPRVQAQQRGQVPRIILSDSLHPEVLVSRIGLLVVAPLSYQICILLVEETCRWLHKPRGLSWPDTWFCSWGLDHGVPAGALSKAKEMVAKFERRSGLQRSNGTSEAVGIEAMAYGRSMEALIRMNMMRGGGIQMRG